MLGYDGPVAGEIPDYSGRILAAMRGLGLDREFEASLSTTSAPLSLDLRWWPPFVPATRDYALSLVWKEDPIVQFRWDKTVFGNPGWDAIVDAGAGETEDPQVDGVTPWMLTGAWGTLTLPQKRALAAIVGDRVKRDGLGPKALLLVEWYGETRAQDFADGVFPPDFPTRPRDTWDIVVRDPDDQTGGPRTFMTLEWRDGWFYDVTVPETE